MSGRAKQARVPAAKPRARWAIAPWQRPHGTRLGGRGYRRAVAKRQFRRDTEGAGCAERCGARAKAAR